MLSGRKDLKKDYVPGPGSYSEIDTLKRDKSPSFRMGTGQRTDIVSKEVTTSPAPGHYDQRSNIGGGPQFTFQSRNEPKRRDNTPGPGGYEGDTNNVKERVVSYKISNSQRPDIVSKEDRKKVGPGEYDSPIRIGKDAPAASIRGRPEDKIKNEVPGPGNYEPAYQAVKDKTISY